MKQELNNLTNQKFTEERPIALSEMDLVEIKRLRRLLGQQLQAEKEERYKAASERNAAQVKDNSFIKEDKTFVDFDKYLDDSQKEMQEELQRIGLTGELTAMVLRPEAYEVVSLASPIIMLPVSFLLQTITSGGLEAESLALGLRQSIMLLRPTGANILLGESLLSLARALRAYHSVNEQFELIMEAIQVFHDCKAEKRMGRAYIELGTNLKDAGALYDALRALELAGKSCLASDDSGGLSASYYHRAHICRLLENEFEALQLLNKAEAILSDRDAKNDWRKQILTEKVFNNLQMDNDSGALAELENWPDFDETDLFPQLKHASYFPFFYRGEILERLGYKERAASEYFKATMILTTQIRKSHSDRFQRIDNLRNNFVYDRGIKIALEKEDGYTALTMLELSRLGSLELRTMHNRVRSSVEQETVIRLQNASKQLAGRLESTLSTNSKSSMKEYQEEADWIVSEWEFFSEPNRDDPSIFLDLGDTLIEDEREIGMQIMSILPTNTVLLQFVSIANDVWIIATLTDHIHTYKLSLTSSELKILSQSLKFELTGRFQEDALITLGKKLLEPLKMILNSNDNLVIVSEPHFYGLPLHALPWQGKPLISTHNIGYMPSGLALLKDRFRIGRYSGIKNSNCIFLGTPTIPYSNIDKLPGVNQEMAAVSKMFNQDNLKIYLPATSKHLLGAAQYKTILHIACHGQFEPEAPLLSRLLFHDRPVFAFELMMTNLNADLVILNACQTAEGILQPGGYMQNLANAFLKAGANSVIAALWSADDLASAVFMENFYDNLFNDQDLTPVAAAMNAQRYVRENVDLSHPYFWAPFLVFGVP